MLLARVFRPKAQLEDLLKPEFAAPTHEPARNVETSIFEVETRSEDTFELGYNARVDSARSETTLTETRTTSRRFSNFAKGKWRASAFHTNQQRNPQPRSEEALPVTPTRFPYGKSDLSRSTNSPSSGATTAPTPLSPSSTLCADVIGDPTALVVSRSSPKVYRLPKGVWVGKLRECPVPMAIYEQWQDQIQLRLIEDLRQAISLQQPPLTGLKGIAEVELCMASDGSNHTSEALLLPTVMISCGGKRCKKVVTDAVESLIYMKHFCNGRVQVHLGAPVLASGIAEGLQDERDIGSCEELEVCVPSGAAFLSACGTKVRYTHTQAGTLQSTWVIGGVIQIGGSLYGLTTGHSFFLDSCSLTLDMDLDESSSGSDSSISSSSFEFSPSSVSNVFETSSAQTAVTSAVSGPNSLETVWTSARLHCLDYTGRKTPGALPPEQCFNVHDWALIEASQWKSQQNSYQIPCLAGTGAKTVISRVSGYVASGEVYIVCSPQDVRQGYLLPSQAYFINGKDVFHTRKIETEAPLGKAQPQNRSFCQLYRTDQNRSWAVWSMGRKRFEPPWHGRGYFQRPAVHSHARDDEDLRRLREGIRSQHTATKREKFSWSPNTTSIRRRTHHHIIAEAKSPVGVIRHREQ